MSADNTIAILKTCKSDEFEFRVQHIQSLEDYAWDHQFGDYTSNLDIQIANARTMWDNEPMTEEEASKEAMRMLQEEMIVEYGIQVVYIPKEF